MRSRLFFVILFLHLVASLGRAQHPRPDALPEPTSLPTPEPYLITFEHTPSPTFGRVNCIIRDDRGFLWFGTTRGLCRYDGYEARVFPNGASLNLRQQVITAILRLDERRLLLGTRVGLWTFDLESAQFAPLVPDSRLPDVEITVLARDSASALWIGTGTAGLLRFDPVLQTVRWYTTEDGLRSNRISCVLIDPGGRIWVGTSLGLNVLDPRTSRFTAYPRESYGSGSSSSAHIMALCANRRGEIWIGTTEGVHVLDPRSGEMRSLPLPSYTRHTIGSITEDMSGRMWIAAAELGLFSFVNGEFIPFTTLHDVGRTLTMIKVLYPDPVASRGSDLLLWIATRSGVNKIVLSRKPFSIHIRNRGGLQLNRGAILAMSEDQGGTLWVGLWGGGLNGLRTVNGTYRRVVALGQRPSGPLPHNDVGILVEDRKGRLWVGTSAGIAILDPQRKPLATVRHVQGDSTSLLHNRIGQIYEDRSGRMWIGSQRGLSLLLHDAPARFAHFLHDPKDAHPMGETAVSDIMEDRASHLWVATYGRGLQRREADGSFTRFTHPGDSLGTQENWIYNLIEGEGGNFWLSSSAGLVSFDPLSGRFTRYVIEHLNDAHIFGIFEDRRGDLWLSTSIGLIRFNPVTHAFVRLDEKHGFPFKELRSGFVRNRRGHLLVGGLDGLAEFDPDSISPASTPPTVVVTSFSVFDKELSSSVFAHRTLRLTYDQNFFSFTFAALDYINPPQNRFAYKMEGVDKDWIQAGTRNFASYTNLDPGTYLFRVKGSNSTHTWNETGTAIAIVITPPYWKTWWFRVAVAVIGLAAVTAAYRYRLRKALEVQRMRLRIADDLHDDVGSNLGTIAMVSRSMQRAPDLSAATQGKIAEIYDTAIKTSEVMKDIVWFIKPKDDTIDDLVLRMRDTASSLLADIAHDFQTSGNGRTARVTIDFKRNFYLAFKEILNNVVKHASATTVEICVRREDDILEVVVRDNGSGFDEPTVRAGNGLGSLRRRATALDGECQVTSAPGRGTAVRFSGRF